MPQDKKDEQRSAAPLMPSSLNGNNNNNSVNSGGGGGGGGLVAAAAVVVAPALDPFRAEEDPFNIGQEDPYFQHAHVQTAQPERTDNDSYYYLNEVQVVWDKGEDKKKHSKKHEKAKTGERTIIHGGLPPLPPVPGAPAETSGAPARIGGATTTTTTTTAPLPLQPRDPNAGASSSGGSKDKNSTAKQSAPETWQVKRYTEDDHESNSSSTSSSSMPEEENVELAYRQRLQDEKKSTKKKKKSKEAEMAGTDPDKKKKKSKSKEKQPKENKNEEAAAAAQDKNKKKKTKSSSPSKSDAKHATEEVTMEVAKDANGTVRHRRRRRAGEEDGPVSTALVEEDTQARFGQKGVTFAFSKGEGEQPFGEVEEGQIEEQGEEETAAELERQALLQRIAPENGGLGRDDGARMPCRFQQASPPYWFKVMNDLLFFQNLTWDASGSGMLPADAAVLQLRSDVARAEQLLRQVQEGKDFRYSQTAKMTEVYGKAKPKPPKKETTVVEVVAAPPHEAAPGAAAIALAPPPLDANLAGPDNELEQESSDTASDAEVPLLSPEEDAADQQRPIQQQIIPIWRRRGAAEKCLTDLIDILRDRLAVLEAQVESGTLWDRKQLVYVGVPASSGADGTQPVRLPPAVEHAYATTVASTLTADLFSSSWSAFPDRAQRLSEAFQTQLPLIHDRYIIEEDIQPVYDEYLLRRPNMLEDPLVPQERGEAETGEERSFSLHIDYVRFHPPLKSAAGAVEETGAANNSLLSSHLSTEDSSDEALFRPGAFKDLKDVSLSHVPRSVLSSAPSVTPLNPTSAARMVTQRLALSTAANKRSAIPFNLEEGLVAVLLQHYERYRLLRLNLLPHLKCRGFYEEQLRHLAAQAQRTPEMNELEHQLERLRKEATDIEEQSMNMMIGVWASILVLRGEDVSRFMVHSRASSASAASGRGNPKPEQEHSFSLDGSPAPRGPAEEATERRVVHENTEFFTSSSSATDEAQSMEAAHRHDCTTSLLLGPSRPPPPPPSDTAQGAASPVMEPDVAPCPDAPHRFRFYLRRPNQTDPVPYVSSDSVLDYIPVVEGVDVVETKDGSQEEEEDVAAAAAAAANGENAVDAHLQHLDQLSFFQVVVFARANAAFPPQYIGCTMPRPITTSKIIFFNETFELRSVHEPQEFLLHVIPLQGSAANARSVLSTVRVRPTLTRSYLLLPLQSPIAFIFKGKTISRSTEAPLEGVMSASTTWTSAQGYTAEQVENLFLNGAADPMDPQYATLVTFLKNYYEESDKNYEQVAAMRLKMIEKENERERARRTRRRRGSGAESSATRRNRSREKTRVDDKGAAPASSVVGGPHADTSAGLLFTERLRMLQRRWLVLTKQVEANDVREVRLYEHPIPLDDEDAHDLRKLVERETAQEEARKAEQFGVGELDFDEKRYYKEPSYVSGLALCPLPKESKLKLWHERQRGMQLTRRAARNITDEELLERYITIPKFILKLVFDLHPRSQLNPRRQARLKTDEIDRDGLKRRQDSNILVHIMKVNNLPERADGTPLEPFVQAGFVYEAVYSRSEVGQSPTWFQTVELPFQPLDFEEETLNMIDDDITIAVYDKVEIPIASTTVTLGAVAHETHYRTERRLLGTLQIPFYSLHQADQARMEGVYPLQMPRWLLGYNQTSKVHTPMINTAATSETRDEAVARAAAAAGAGNPLGDAKEGEEKLVAEAKTARTVEHVAPTIQLYLSLWPPLQREKIKGMSKEALIRAVRQLNVSAELRYLHEVALKWRGSAMSKIKSIANINATASSREVEPFAFCSTGDMVLVCRYLLPHGGPPPACVTNVYEAIRYVSLLPFVADIMTWGDKDVWSTNVELLELRSSDYEELALLLAHFLRHLQPDYPTYVVVGKGEIYEQTIMVLHCFEGVEWRLIDPRTGFLTSVERPNATVLRDVHIVISHNQLWANVQLSGLPHRMTWDFSQPANWLPCFDIARDKRLPSCLQQISPIQREVLSFEPADPNMAKEVEHDLRSALKKALLAWRHHRPPAYHHGLEGVLRELLVEAEEERCTCGTARTPAVTALATRRIRDYLGYPVEAPRRRRRRKTSATDVDRQDRSQNSRNTEDDLETSTLFGSAKRKTPATVDPAAADAVSVQLVGSPVTASYNPSDVQFNEILLRVFETAAHEVGTDDATFATGVYVKSYTGNVCAMWVFLLAMYRTGPTFH